MRSLFKCFPFLLLALPVGMALSLGSCSMPTAVPPEPTCLPEELINPTNLQPNDNTASPGDTSVLESTSPTFSWEYTGGCIPEGYEVEVFKPHPDAALATYRDSTLASSTSLVLDESLEPGAFYAWQVSAYTGVYTSPPSMLAFFLTGPLCTAAEVPVTPVLLHPEDGAVITEGSTISVSDGSTLPTVSFYMIWDDPLTCLPPEGYTVQVSDSPTFPDDVTHTSDYSMDYRTMMLFFFPPGVTWSECVPYYWRVLTELPGGLTGPVSETRTFMINLSGADCGLPAATPVPTAVSEPADATVIQDCVCRTGPTMTHNVLDFLGKGSIYRIDGRNLEGTWWWIYDESIKGNCWVSGNVVETSGATADLPVITPPDPEVELPTDTPKVIPTDTQVPLPTDTPKVIPTDTQGPPPTDTPVVGCMVLQKDQTVICVSPCPPGAVPGNACVMP